MRLIEKVTGIKPRAPTGEDAPRGNLDDALIAQAEAEASARIKALAQSEPRIKLPSSPFTPEPPPEPLVSLSISPHTRGVVINTNHPLQSTVDEIGGKVTLTLKW